METKINCKEFTKYWFDVSGYLLRRELPSFATLSKFECFYMIEWTIIEWAFVNKGYEFINLEIFIDTKYMIIMEFY